MATSGQAGFQQSFSSFSGFSVELIRQAAYLATEGAGQVFVAIRCYTASRIAELHSGIHNPFRRHGRPDGVAPLLFLPPLLDPLGYPAVVVRQEVVFQVVELRLQGLQAVNDILDTVLRNGISTDEFH